MSGNDRVLRISFLLLSLVSVSALRLWADYDPLLVVKDKPEQMRLVVKDEKRQREIPIRVYLPKGQAPAAVILFSHGLGGTNEGMRVSGQPLGLERIHSRVFAASGKR